MNKADERAKMAQKQIDSILREYGVTIELDRDNTIYVKPYARTGEKEPKRIFYLDNIPF